MPHRYRAPKHCSAVGAPSRDYVADEAGIIELPDDAPDCDHDALRRAGCEREPANAAEALESPEIAPGGDPDGNLDGKGKPKA